MSWIDFALVLALVSIAALGAERRLAGFFVGVGGVLLLRPLLVLADLNPFMALVVALAAGLGLSLLGRRIGNQRRGRSWLFRVLGGIGGLALGLVLVLSLTTTLPIQENGTGQIVYPPRIQGDVQPAMPQGYGPISDAVNGSQLIGVGKRILLYPLLEEPTASGNEIFRSLHSYLIVGEPWNER
jgi:hypothetical protein